MNSRDWLMLSAAAAFGALSSSCATYFLFGRTRKWFACSSTRCRSGSSNVVVFDSFYSSSENGIIDSNGTKYQSQSPFDPSKRKGYLSWDDYFMAIAFLSAERSKDPNRQVGACLVSQNGIILGIGYNGFPRGCPDDKLPWSKKSKTGNPLETKYPAGVKVRRHQPQMDQILIKFEEQ